MKVAIASFLGLYTDFTGRGDREAVQSTSLFPLLKLTNLFSSRIKSEATKCDIIDLIETIIVSDDIEKLSKAMATWSKQEERSQISTDFLGLVVKVPVPNFPELQRTQQLKEQRVNNTETNGSY